MGNRPPSGRCGDKMEAGKIVSARIVRRFGSCLHGDETGHQVRWVDGGVVQLCGSQLIRRRVVGCCVVLTAGASGGDLNLSVKQAKGAHSSVLSHFGRERLPTVIDNAGVTSCRWRSFSAQVSAILNARPGRSTQERSPDIIVSGSVVACHRCARRFC